MRRLLCRGGDRGAGPMVNVRYVFIFYLGGHSCFISSGISFFCLTVT